MSFGLWGFMDTVFPIVFMLIFFCVIAVFVTAIVQGLTQWNKNNHSPRLTVEATVVAKRQDVSHHHHNHSNGHVGSSTSTSYYGPFRWKVETGWNFP